MAFITQRGLMRNQFWVRDQSGWPVTYSRGSLKWCGATVLNLMFLSASLFLTYEAIFHGSEFDRQPVRPMPFLSGTPTITVHANLRSQQVAACIADLNRGQAYRLDEGHWRVAVWGDRGRLLDTVELVDEASGSRVDIYESFLSYVDRESCLTGGAKSAEPISETPSQG